MEIIITLLLDFAGCTTGYFGLFLCVGAGTFGQSFAGNGVFLISRVHCMSRKMRIKSIAKR